MSAPTSVFESGAGSWGTDSPGPRAASRGRTVPVLFPSIRVGVDVVAVSDVAESVDRFGDRYLDRIFTPHEVAYCRSEHGSGRGTQGYSAESLAARFAAKEAVVKVLRPPLPHVKTSA